jgi:hypothetical protein
MTTTKKKYPKIDAALDALGLAYEAEFVPLSQSRNKNWKEKKEYKHPTLEWKIKIGKKHENHPLGMLWPIQTEYGEGIGHAPGYQFQFGQNGWKDQYFTLVAEKGRYLSSLPKFSDGEKTDWFEAHERMKSGRGKFNKLSPPEFRDVMYSLLQDSDVIDRGSFEEWAGELGFDTDSRSAERIYKECLDMALKLRNLIGDAKMTELREIFQEEGF